MDRPTPAERARTALRSSPTVELVAAGMREVVAEHGTDRSGRPLLMLDASSPVVAAVRVGAVPALVSAASLRPVEVADRVRARVELCGHLRDVRRLPSGRVLLHGEVLAVSLDGRAVDPHAYAAARPDPFVDAETELLRTLLRPRPAALAEVCAAVEPELVAAATAIAPSGLDRHGVTAWLAGPGWTREIRIAFAGPLDRGADVAAAVEELLGARPAPVRMRTATS